MNKLSFISIAVFSTLLHINLVSAQIENSQPIAITEDAQGNSFLQFDTGSKITLPEVNFKTANDEIIIDKSTTIPRVDYVFSKVEEKRLSLKKMGRQLTVDELGFHDLSNGIPWSNMPFSINEGDESIISNDSENILFVNGNKVRRIYKETEFGSLLIEEVRNTKVYFATPTIEIAGHTASIVTVKHQDGRWVTAITISADLDRVITIEVNKRLKGIDRIQFLKWAESLV
jgi:hypothetical protein